MEQVLSVRRLGRVPYDKALALQEELVEERKGGRIPDTLLLLEHPHVVTLGVRRGGRANIVATPERLEQLGVAVVEAGRGGDVTYHGPGQLVGYPIVDLRPDRQDVHRYVRDLEEVLMRVCADFGVSAERLAGFSGGWVRHPVRGFEKIAAIGVRIARWITSHGFAINVNTDLEFFNLIVPCGISGRGVTSLQAVTGMPIEMGIVEEAVARRFAEVFSRNEAASLRSADMSGSLRSPV
jgi:lipoyl(octanoyl) transferase